MNLDEFLAQPHKTISQYTLHHQTSRSFRWTGILEVALLLVACFWILVPAYIILLIATRGSLGLGKLHRLHVVNRFRYTWHEVHIEAQSTDGNTQHETTIQIIDPEMGHRAISILLAHANKHDLLVIEITDEHITHWFGDQPLLSKPDLSSERELWERLERARCKRTIKDKETTILFNEAPPSTITLILRVLVYIAFFPLLLHEPNREALRRNWAQLRANDAPQWSFSLSKAALRISLSFGHQVFEEHLISNADILGITWAPALTYGRRSWYEPHALHIALRGGIRRIHIPEQLGRHIADYLLAERLTRLRSTGSVSE